MVETRNESVDKIDEIELIGETYNKNMDAKTDGESRIGETEYVTSSQPNLIRPIVRMNI